MTAVDAPVAPDIRGLMKEFRADFLPAVSDFLTNRITATRLREVWRPYYAGAFEDFDRAVEQSWRRVAASDGRVEAGPPQTDPAQEEALRLFPVSVAHNNLDRLVEVLAVELADGVASDGHLPERIVDLAHVVDALNRLMTSLVDQ
jgi:hypothetical protein